jgi:hypothetical protein
VIRTLEAREPAVGLLHDARAAVPAHVVEGAQGAVAAADDREALPCRLGEEVLAGVRGVLLAADIQPRGREPRFLLVVVDLRVVEDARRQERGTLNGLSRGRDLGGADGRGPRRRSAFVHRVQMYRTLRSVLFLPDARRERAPGTNRAAFHAGCPSGERLARTGPRFMPDERPRSVGPAIGRTFLPDARSACSGVSSHDPERARSGPSAPPAWTWHENGAEPGVVTHRVCTWHEREREASRPRG